jgi:hypothetical protein
MGSHNDSYTFKGKSERLAQFLDFIDKCGEYEVTATRKRFIMGVLKVKVATHTLCPVCSDKQLLCNKCGMCWECCSSIECFYQCGVASISGYLSTFFSAALGHGMVEKVRLGRTIVYKRGPNAEKWEKGEY